MKPKLIKINTKDSLITFKDLEGKKHTMTLNYGKKVYLANLSVYEKRLSRKNKK